MNDRPTPKPIVWTFSLEPIWPPGFVAQLPGLMRGDAAGAKKSLASSAANQRQLDAEGIDQRLRAIRAPSRSVQPLLFSAEGAT